MKMVGVTGFEPVTSASRKQRSTKLSYTPMVLERDWRLAVALHRETCQIGK